MRETGFSMTPRESQVRSLAENVFGEQLKVCRSSEGSDLQTWFLGQHVVARFALDESTSCKLRREVAVRRALQEKLPVMVPDNIALVAWQGQLTAAVDERVPGLSAERQRLSYVGERQISVMLASLRALDREHFRLMGVPERMSWNLEELQSQAAEAIRTLSLHASCLPECDTSRLQETVHPVLCHSDLKGEHFLLSRSGRVLGVIDWLDVSVADPALDISGLVISFGAESAVRMATRAGYGSETCRRALFVARCESLIRLARQLRRGDQGPEPLLREQLKRAVIATQLDGGEL